MLSLQEWMGKVEKLEKVNESFYDYEQKLIDFNMNALQARKDSQFLVLGGCGSIIISSSMSVFYALERNTRKKED